MYLKTESFMDQSLEFNLIPIKIINMVILVVYSILFHRYDKKGLYRNLQMDLYLDPMKNIKAESLVMVQH